MIRAFQWDLARQVERLDWLLAQLPRYAAWGYEELYLHLEDAIEYPSFPGIARPGAYRYRQIDRLVTAAGRVGIRVVPIVNLLGHTQYLIKVPGLRDLNELREKDGSPQARGQICPVHPRTPEVAARLLRDVAPLCSAGKVHVGLDESFLLGRHPLSRAEIRRIGLAAHFAGHVQRLHGLATGLGLRLGMWADMLYFLPAAIPLLPRPLAAYDWYYYPFRRRPRVEFYNFAERDLAAPLQARGLEYWGCPMNGAFRAEPLPIFADRLDNIRSWWRRCREVSAAGLLITSWEPQHLTPELPAALDAAAAQLWQHPGADRLAPATLLARGFAAARPGTPPAAARRAARAALAADRYPFSGYARWERNLRWDGGEPVPPAAARAERRFFAAAASAGHPPALAASLAWRLYLAEREVFLVESRRALRAARADAAARPRRLRELRALAADFAAALDRGAASAARLWRRTRRPRDPSANARVVALDRGRLAEYRQWLDRAAADPAGVLATSPLLGAAQLSFVVRNFAPAVQRVAVEQRRAGRWREIAGRHTIEFQARAARARTAISREFSVPLVDFLDPVRVVVSGVGRVEVGSFHLEGSGAPALARVRRRLGRPAPAAGLPRLDAPASLVTLPLAAPAAG